MRLPTYQLTAHVKAITYCLLCLAPFASIDPSALDASIITGAFYTSQTDISGTVIPWRLVLNYKQKIQQKNELAIRMNSQTGITTGPYIDGFNTEIEYFRIETIQYTRAMDELTTSRLGFGKLKANILKKGGTQTPMPFSRAMAKLPLSPSDVAFGIQRSARNFNGAYTLGTAASNISTSTDSSKRSHSGFAEVYTANSSGEWWAQYSHNNLVDIFHSDQYFSLGYNTMDPDTVLNGTLYYGIGDGMIGFDCGLKRNQIKQLDNGQFGIGYGYSQDKQKTMEISLTNKHSPTLETIISWYAQKPKNTDLYHVAGFKVTHKL